VVEISDKIYQLIVIYLSHNNKYLSRNTAVLFQNFVNSNNVSREWENVYLSTLIFKTICQYVYIFLYIYKYLLFTYTYFHMHTYFHNYTNLNIYPYWRIPIFTYLNIFTYSHIFIYSMCISAVVVTRCSRRVSCRPVWPSIESCWASQHET